MLMGVVAIINASKGICVVHVLLGFKRNISPWELRPDTVEAESGLGDSDMEMRGFARDVDVGHAKDWMRQYNSQPMRKRLYEKKGSIQESAIIKAQQWIIVQSVFFGTCAAFVYCAIFLSLPVARII